MKMCSRDDETLPLTGFSENYSADVTVDEDFIPTSQPQSISSKVTKSEESSVLESFESNTQALSGFVDDTLPPEALIQETQDQSADFIPETETKKSKQYNSHVVGCRKNLPLFGTEDIFGSHWEKKELENCTSELQTNPILCNSPKMDSQSLKVPEDSITEILVNDSAETVELGDTPVKGVGLGVVTKLENCERFNLDTCEETQALDNSVLLLDQLRPSCLNQPTSQELYLNETVDESKVNNSLKLPGDSGEVFAIEKQINDCVLQHPPKTTNSQNADTTESPVILNTKVNEKAKPKTPLLYSENSTDFGSDKSKRLSTSSSGSVYSDKNGLPFVLPKRISAVPDQTCASDSSGDTYAKHFAEGQRNKDRVLWTNESLICVKMDEILKRMIDNEDLINRQSPKKLKKSLCRNESSRLEYISENESFSEALKSETDEFPSENYLEGESLIATKDNISSLLPEESIDDSIQKNSVDAVNNEEPQLDSNKQMSPESNKEKRTSPEPEEGVRLRNGLRVFARWTDKRYYSGVLSGQSKNDKWDVLFDDGTLKAIKEDFILPVVWLKKGGLAFALVGDSYESGQVIGLKNGENPTYVVELDDRKEELTVELSDIALSDDMASILKENYRPAITESPQKKADINCDNLVSGKRQREFRTPLKPPLTTRIGSTGSKKKPTSKRRNSEMIKETSKKKKSELRAENGHLVEDKVESAESLSGNETAETPIRRAGKEARGKTKPRSLTYEPEEKQKKRKPKEWLKSDGTPIPGPSGVKFKKKNEDELGTVSQIEQSLDKTESESPKQTEKNKRKRKAIESEKTESPKKKSLTETEIRVTRGRRR